MVSKIALAIPWPGFLSKNNFIRRTPFICCFLGSVDHQCAIIVVINVDRVDDLAFHKAPKLLLAFQQVPTWVNSIWKRGTTIVFQVLIRLCHACSRALDVNGPLPAKLLRQLDTTGVRRGRFLHVGFTANRCLEICLCTPGPVFVASKPKPD